MGLLVCRHFCRHFCRLSLFATTPFCRHFCLSLFSAVFTASHCHFCRHFLFSALFHFTIKEEEVASRPPLLWANAAGGIALRSGSRPAGRIALRSGSRPS